MHKKYFIVGIILILLAGLLIHLYPLLTNQFYFTMDQGRDAVHVRELLTRGKILLEGPETSTPGVYHGVLWYYFIAIGYMLFGGSPAGAVWMLVLLNLLTLFYLMKTMGKHVSPKLALITGVSLLVFWKFYETSSYAFNPFALVALGIMLVTFLAQAATEDTKKFVIAAIPVGLAFHAHVLGAVCFLLLYILAELWLLKRHMLSWGDALRSKGILLLFFIPHLISEATTGMSQWNKTLAEFQSTSGFFSHSSVPETSKAFLEILSQTVFPQHHVLGIIGAVVLILYFLWDTFRKKDIKKIWTAYFVLLSLTLFIISWLFFITNDAWRLWVTVYLPPLLFISILLIIWSLPKKFATVLYVTLFLCHAIYFTNLYRHVPTSDQSLLSNEIDAIDWIYQKAEGKGFREYSYLPSVLDYPYQYLIWWHGKKAYTYLPCEYASYPGSPKLFVPGSSHYENPTKPCTNLTFLVVEPDAHTELRDAWLKNLQVDSTLLDSENVGNILVEMRETHSK